ncbi:hypothetical protein B296_00050621 [Ensete ventricosum]|uniref:Uncharacterized protein n=1 Tax=Ensete ventricosum TaxID=4639 RepID=A0A426XY36_ENSVE|nr:hypothetical protein B296_00050621 [Ensete ventricosum]
MQAQERGLDNFGDESNQRFGRREGKGRRRTLLVASGEDDGTGLVTEEALGNPDGARVSGALVEDGLGCEHLRRKGVPGRPGLQPIHLREHRLPLRASRYLLLRRRHGR